MYSTYIIQSQKIGRYYIGSTANIENRINHHNNGGNRSTKNGRPWKLVYKEDYENKKDTWLRESQIKRYKSGEAFKKLVSSDNRGGVA